MNTEPENLSASFARTSATSAVKSLAELFKEVTDAHFDFGNCSIVHLDSPAKRDRERDRFCRRANHPLAPWRTGRRRQRAKRHSDIDALLRSEGKGNRRCGHRLPRWRLQSSGRSRGATGGGM